MESICSGLCLLYTSDRLLQRRRHRLRIVVKGLVRPDMQITPLLAEIDGTPVDLSKTVGAAQ